MFGIIRIFNNKLLLGLATLKNIFINTILLDIFYPKLAL